jgi:DNA gyrase/topoisomerase IV subunit A
MIQNTELFRKTIFYNLINQKFFYNQLIEFSKVFENGFQEKEDEFFSLDMFFNEQLMTYCQQLHKFNEKFLQEMKAKIEEKIEKRENEGFENEKYFDQIENQLRKLKKEFVQERKKGMKKLERGSGLRKSLEGIFQSLGEGVNDPELKWLEKLELTRKNNRPEMEMNSTSCNKSVQAKKVENVGQWHVDMQGNFFMSKGDLKIGKKELARMRKLMKKKVIETDID